jgi:hypothetical protein
MNTCPRKLKLNTTGGTASNRQGRPRHDVQDDETTKKVFIQ